MKNKVKTMTRNIQNRLMYILTLILMLFILSCDEDTPVTNPDPTDSFFYCLTLEHVVEGGNIDYADNNSNDQRVITVKLESSTNQECTESLTSVPNASLTFNWDFANSSSQGSAEPHLQTIPIGNESAIDIYQNEAATTNQNGEISFYWIDEGQDGCISLYCDYIEDDTIWSLPDPDENCENSSNNSNPFQIEAIEVTYSNIEYFELDLSPDTLIFNDLPSSVDSTNSDNELIIRATVKDESGVGIQYIPIDFSNTTPNFGTLTQGTVNTNATGVSENTLVNIDTDQIDEESLYATITINANITGGEFSETKTESAFLVPQSLNNIWQVSSLDAVFLQNLNLINNVNLTFSDTIFTQVLDEQNTPIQSVPIHFNLSTESNVGYIDNELVYSDQFGIAKTVFHITPADLDNYSSEENEIDLSITVFVSETYQTTLNRTYVIDGSANIENDVSEFYFYPDQSMESITFYAYPSDNPGSYQGIEERIPVMVRDGEGHPISNVPVQFDITSSGSRSNGSLSSALTYTCCDETGGSEDNTDDSGGDTGAEENQDDNSSNQLIDWNGDGNITQEENMGIAHVTYSNSVISAFDVIHAFITNPNSQDINIASKTLTVNTSYIDDQASLLDVFATPASINVNVLDSTYCDTLYAIARDPSGMPLKDIPINFSIDQNDINYGLISNNYSVTDTVSSLGYFAATSTFCTWPNIEFNGETINVDISAQIQNSELIDNVSIPITENLPDCPDCEESLNLEATYYELPGTDQSNEDVFTSLITATVVDSTENPVPQNTLVQFQSLTENENGDLNTQIGNIDPWSYTGTDDNGDANGRAEAIFNMGNDVGLATIIATAPQYNLADTIYISLYSTDAAYVEINQPFPNEIMLQGGGGLSSTEIEVEVKDGNGNLVSEPFSLRFEIQSNAPTGVFLNEQDEDWNVEWVESSNGIATVTLNSGDQPGSIPIRVELYDSNLPIDVNEDDCEFFTNSTCPDSCGDCDEDDDGVSDNFELYGIASAEDIPVTVLTGPPHSGEINFSYVDITPIGGGLYQVPLSVQLEDEWANPVSDSTNVYIWIEGHAPAFNMDYYNGGLYDTRDTLKWGEETIENSINIRDSLLYVLLVDDADDNGSITASDIALYTPNPVDMTTPNQQNFQSTGDSNTLGIPDTDPSACNCYANELYNQCSNGSGGTLCIWEVIPTQPGSVVGEAKTGMLGPNNESIPGVAWSNVYYGTSDMFARTVIKALTYDIDGQELVIDSRNNHSGEPLILPYQPGGEGVTVSPSLVFWDFGTMGMASAAVEPDWVNDINIADDISAGISVTVTLTDYYQYGVDNGIVLLSAPGSAVDETFDVGFSQVGSTYDWVACNPVDTDGDGFTGACSLPEYDNNCSECVANLGTWAPDQTENGATSGSYDDNQSLCITNSSGQCTWIIHYSEYLTPEQGGGGGDVTYADFTSTLIATLQNPLITTSAGVDIRLEKNPPAED